jgi:predicted nucleotidyltransferase
MAHLGAEKGFLADRYDVRSLGVFGSYVRGEADPQSDLDVLVEFANPPSLFQFVRLQNELSDLLGVRVDLVMKSALKPVIGERILEEYEPCL